MAAFLAACYAASQLRGGNAGDEAAAFAAVWTVLLLVGISVLGTIIMRKVNQSLCAILSTLMCTFL